MLPPRDTAPAGQNNSVIYVSGSQIQIQPPSSICSSFEPLTALSSSEPKRTVSTNVHLWPSSPPQSEFAPSALLPDTALPTRCPSTPSFTRPLHPCSTMPWMTSQHHTSYTASTASACWRSVSSKTGPDYLVRAATSCLISFSWAQLMTADILFVPSTLLL